MDGGYLRRNEGLCFGRLPNPWRCGLEGSANVEAQSRRRQRSDCDVLCTDWRLEGDNQWCAQQLAASAFGVVANMVDREAEGGLCISFKTTKAKKIAMVLMGWVVKGKAECASRVPWFCGRSKRPKCSGPPMAPVNGGCHGQSRGYFPRDGIPQPWIEGQEVVTSNGRRKRSPPDHESFTYPSFFRDELQNSMFFIWCAGNEAKETKTMKDTSEHTGSEF